MSKTDKPAKAPFNFVSLPSKFIERYENEEQLPDHGRIYKKEEGYYSGEITYKAVIDSGSALFISDGNLPTDEKTKKTKQIDEFFRNADGKYTIPGSSIRGLIYNNIQILGLCDPRDFIEDSRFTYRDMASGDAHHRNVYNQAIGKDENKDKKGNEKTYQELQGVKAGYLKKIGEGEKYEIIPAAGYYKVREDKIRDKLGDNEKISYMYYDKNKLERAVKLQDKESRKKELKNNKNKDFKPYFCQIYYKLNDKNEVIPDSLQFASADGLKEGYLLCSGYIPGKLTHYVIGVQDSEALTVKLNEQKHKEIVRWYQDDLTRRKESREFYQLPTDDKPIKPIFYTEDKNNIWIGMTPYLRILYEHSVHDGIRPRLQAACIDYAKAMFGFTAGGRKKEAAYKSRLSFTDAPAKGKVDVGEPVEILPGAPKPTCYPEYIVQNQNDLVSYADNGFSIRGYKQYWFSDRLKTMREKKNEKVIRKIRPITNASFEGKIYFENLTKDELGLLAFALKISDEACHGIGMAKSYGYGRIKIEDIEINTYDYDAMYRSFVYDQKDYTKENIDELIKAYKDFVSEKYGIDIQNETGVKEFIYMKTHCLKAELIEYQELNEFKDNCILPKVQEYEKKHKEYKNNFQKAQPQSSQYSGKPDNKKYKNSENSRRKENSSKYDEGTLTYSPFKDIKL